MLEKLRFLYPYKFLFLFFIIFCIVFFVFLKNNFFYRFSSNQIYNLDQADIIVNINPLNIKSNDFAQLLGGYIDTRGNLDPSSKFILSGNQVIQTSREIFPQTAEFDVPVVMRTKSYFMLSNDYFALTDEEVEDVINYCSQANCDPMFGAHGEGSFAERDGMKGLLIDVTEGAIKKRAQFVKDKCFQYFGDNNHCRHWDIGNEPPSTPQNCDYYGNTLIPTAIRAISSVMPDAIFHAPELYLDSSLVRDSNITIGECIIDKVNKVNSNYRIGVVTTHWYSYVCGPSNNRNLSALNIDGNAVLNWNGFGKNIEKMTYPYSIINTMSWLNKYSTTSNSVIGIGEVSQMAACDDRIESDPEIKSQVSVTKRVNGTWGSSFWHLDILGIMGEAGIKYSQKHIFIGTNANYSLLNYNTSNGTVIKTAPFYAYSFYSKYFGKKLIESSSNNPSIVNSHASIDKQGNIRLLLINKSGSGSKPNSTDGNNGLASSKTVSINFKNFSAKNNVDIFTLKIPGDFNSREVNGNYFSENKNVVLNNSVFNLEPYTAVIIKFYRNDGVINNTPIPTTVVSATPSPTKTPTPKITPTPISTIISTPNSTPGTGVNSNCIHPIGNSCAFGITQCSGYVITNNLYKVGWECRSDPTFCKTTLNAPFSYAYCEKVSIPTPVSTPIITPISSPITSSCSCEKIGTLYRNVLYKCNYNSDYQLAKFRITYKGFPFASMETTFSQNNWYYVPSIEYANLECRVCQNSNDCSSWIKVN